MGKTTEAIGFLVTGTIINVMVAFIVALMVGSIDLSPRIDLWIIAILIYAVSIIPLVMGVGKITDLPDLEEELDMAKEEIKKLNKEVEKNERRRSKSVSRKKR